MALRGNRLSVYADMGDGLAPVGLALDASLSINTDVVEVAGVSSAAKSHVAGRYGWRITANTLYCADATSYTYKQQFDLLTSILNGRPLKVAFADVAAYNGQLHEVSLPTIVYSGDAIVSSYTVNAPVSGYANISVELVGTGDLTAEDLDVVDGGAASTAYTDTIDGGQSSTTYDNTLEGGQSI